MSSYAFARSAIPYVRVAARRQQAAHRLAKLRKKGNEVSPVQIEGRKIATTFWGKAWCEIWSATAISTIACHVAEPTCAMDR